MPNQLLEVEMLKRHWFSLVLTCILCKNHCFYPSKQCCFWKLMNNYKNGNIHGLGGEPPIWPGQASQGSQPASQSASVASQAQPAKRGRWMASQSALQPAMDPIVDYMDPLIDFMDPLIDFMDPHTDLLKLTWIPL